MPTCILGQALGLAGLDVGTEQMLFNRRYLERIVIDVLALDIHQFQIGIGLDYALGFTALDTAQIEVPVAVTYVGLVDEVFGIIGQECERMLRLDITVIVVGKECAKTFSVGGIVHVEMHVLLGTVQYLN